MILWIFMFTMSLNRSVPIHDQLVDEFRRLIAEGKVRVGDEFPPVRQLATDLGVNLNTVARAYRALSKLGLLSSERGRGTVLISAVERKGLAQVEARKRVEASISLALADAKIAGMSLAMVEAIVEKQVEKYWKSD